MRADVKTLIIGKASLYSLERNRSLCRLKVSASVSDEYNVYNNLETAEARMLLPFKVGQFSVLQDDMASVSEISDIDLLPACVGVDEVRILLFCCTHASLSIVLQQIGCCYVEGKYREQLVESCLTHLSFDCG
jgi:hypothetical protein